MTPPASVVFLLDVDNTLLDNDRVIADLRRHLAQAFGTDDQAPGAERADLFRPIHDLTRGVDGWVVAALEPHDVVLGGGNVRKLAEMPPGCRRGDNANAFRGGFRLWEASR